MMKENWERKLFYLLTPALMGDTCSRIISVLRSISSNHLDGLATAVEQYYQALPPLTSLAESLRENPRLRASRLAPAQFPRPSHPSRAARHAASRDHGCAENALLKTTVHLTNTHHPKPSPPSSRKSGARS